MASESVNLDDYNAVGSELAVPTEGALIQERLAQFAVAILAHSGLESERRQRLAQCVTRILLENDVAVGLDERSDPWVDGTLAVARLFERETRNIELGTVRRAHARAAHGLQLVLVDSPYRVSLNALAKAVASGNTLFGAGATLERFGGPQALSLATAHYVVAAYSRAAAPSRRFECFLAAARLGIYQRSPRRPIVHLRRAMRFAVTEEERVRVIALESLHAYRQDMPRHAELLLAEAERLLAGSVRCPAVSAEIAHYQGLLHASARSTRAARGYLGRALGYYRASVAALAFREELGDVESRNATRLLELGLAQVENTLGRLELEDGRSAEALRLARSSLVSKRRHGDRYGLGLSLGLLGTILAHTGRNSEAESLLRDSYARSIECGDRSGARYPLAQLALSHVRVASASELAGRGSSSLLSCEPPPAPESPDTQGLALLVLARVALLRRDFEDAESLLKCLLEKPSFHEPSTEAAVQGIRALCAVARDPASGLALLEQHRQRMEDSDLLWESLDFCVERMKALMGAKRREGLAEELRLMRVLRTRLGATWVDPFADDIQREVET